MYAPPPSRAIDKMRGEQGRAELLGNLFAGLSLGSVLLLAALGLAITYGLIGVINMAHGEFLMIGAYATYVVQTLFRAYAPNAFGLVPAGGAAGVVPGGGRRRLRHRADRAAPPVRPPARDAAGHLRYQPAADAGRAHHLRRPERGSGQSQLDERRRHRDGRPR